MVSSSLDTRGPRFRNPKSLIQKDGIHLFKASSRGLWIEQPGNGYEYCVEQSPNDVQSVTETVNGLRGDIHNDKVREPVGSGTQSDAFVSRPKRHNL